MLLLQNLLSKAFDKIFCKENIIKCNTNKTCPELKHNMLKPKHNRQLMNYIKKYSILCCIINNDNVYSRIKSDTASRGRFLDYSLKLLIKQTVKGLIKENRINPNLPVRLVINIDEQTTKTNGYYNLRDSIIEELKYGIFNYNYGFFNTPIINGSLEVNVCYQKSEKSFLIQASDLVAGTVRKLYLNNLDNFLEFSKRTEFINYRIFLP